MDEVDAVVIGAGVVGLACARALAQAGRDVLVLESERGIGSGVSSRNSEVIHAGIYYPTGSLKAALCVEGKALLYSYCEARGIAARPLGKLIVAVNDAQRARLEALERQAAVNGVHDLAWLDGADVRALEPELTPVVAALHSPSTGIVDSHAFMLALQGDIEDAGGAIAFNAPIESGRVTPGGCLALEVGGAEPTTLRARIVVNAAGLYAPEIAGRMEGVPRASVPQPYLAKGNYYALTGVRSPFRRLVYPMPEAAGLGIHATVDLAGQVRFGPDVEWIERLDYDVDPRRADVFYEAIRSYWPALPDGALTPSYSGVRPKISGPGAPAADFVIQGAEIHGAPGLVQLYGIESPGLTASLAIADRARDSAIASLG